MFRELYFIGVFGLLVIIANNDFITHKLINMKTIKSNAIVLFSLLLLIFSISGCKKSDEVIDDVIDECDEAVNQISPPQSITFQEVCQVYLADGSWLIGAPVKMEIQKQYCEGNYNGYFTLSGTTGNWAVWDSNYQRTYDYHNKKDRVLVTFTISYGGLDYEFDYVYRWEDVESGGLQYLTKTINLPV